MQRFFLLWIVNGGSLGGALLLLWFLYSRAKLELGLDRGALKEVAIGLVATLLASLVSRFPESLGSLVPRFDIGMPFWYAADVFVVGVTYKLTHFKSMRALEAMLVLPAVFKAVQLFAFIGVLQHVSG